MNFLILARSRFGQSLLATMIVFALVPSIALTVIGGSVIQNALNDRSLRESTALAEAIKASLQKWMIDATGQLDGFLQDPAIAQNSVFILASPAQNTRAA